MQKAQHSEKELQPQIDLITHIEAIVQEAEKQTKEQQIPTSKAEKVRGIREHRSFEKQFIQNEDSVHSQLGFRERANSIDISDSSAAVDYFNDFDLLRKKREEG